MTNDVLEREFCLADQELEAHRKDDRTFSDDSGITMNYYQINAAMTARSFDGKFFEGLTCWTMCLCGEAGELANIVKKIVWHDHLPDFAKLIDEMGDVLWYLTLLATLLHVDLEDVAKRNLAKLRERYPEGFDPERSKNRGSE